MYPELHYTSSMYRGRAQKSKREQAADHFNEGRRLAKEALAEENIEIALTNEYGPIIYPHKETK